MLNSIECNGGFNPQGIPEHKMSFILNRNMSTSETARTPKSRHQTPIRHGGGFGRHVSKAEKEANEILHQELANVINCSTPSSGIRIRALKSFYNSTGRVPRGREREPSLKSLDIGKEIQELESK